MPQQNETDEMQWTLLEDPSDGLIVQRVVLQPLALLKVSNLSPGSKEAVTRLIQVIAYKFVALWQHDQAFTSIEFDRIEASRNDVQDKRSGQQVRMKVIHQLWIEFDEFMVQLKSMLDHIAKVLRHTHGIPELRTFGDKGEGVIKALRNNVRKDAVGQRRTAIQLAKFIRKNQISLRAIVSLRDQMNHFADGGVSPLAFTVARVVQLDGTERLYRPLLVEKVYLKDTMTQFFTFALEFFEYFVGVALMADVTSHGIRWRDDASGVDWHWELIPEAEMDRRIDAGEVPVTHVVGLRDIPFEDIPATQSRRG